MSTRDYYAAYAAVGPDPDAARWYHLGIFATEAEASAAAASASLIYYRPVVRKVEK